MMPRHVTRSVKSTGSPSTLNATSPKADRLKPVAVTTMSAGISSPELTRIPFSVKVSIVSVTIEAFPSRSAANRSPSGTMAMRCCHGR
jgi:hypothetical protein